MKRNLPSHICAGLLLLFIAFLSGCTTKAHARKEAQAAFIAGQQQAMQRALQMRNSVSFIGPVRNQNVPWTTELTLAKALLLADYYGPSDPSEIILVRNGQAQRIDPKQLLAGEDVPLQLGDIVQIK